MKKNEEKWSYRSKYTFGTFNSIKKITLEICLLSIDNDPNFKHFDNNNNIELIYKIDETKTEIFSYQEAKRIYKLQQL